MPSVTINNDASRVDTFSPFFLNTPELIGCVRGDLRNGCVLSSYLEVRVYGRSV